MGVPGIRLTARHGTSERTANVIGRQSGGKGKPFKPARGVALKVPLMLAVSRRICQLLLIFEFWLEDRRQRKIKRWQSGRSID